MEPPLWTTTIEAIDPETGDLCLWAGPHVPGFTRRMAENYCNTHGLGYCRVHGLLVEEVPTKPDGVTPDWSKRKRFVNPNHN